MAAKTTRVTLITKKGGHTQDFEVTHAERILRLRNSAWTLPENSEYRFENGSIIRHTTKSPKRRVGKDDGNKSNRTSKPSKISRPDGTDG